MTGAMERKDSVEFQAFILRANQMETIDPAFCSAASTGMNEDGNGAFASAPHRWKPCDLMRIINNSCN
jgi:hypothetical protein